MRRQQVKYPQGQPTPPGGWTDWNRQTGRTSEADYNWKPAPGEGVQDFINSGKIGWTKGLGNIGYFKPQIGGGGPDTGGGGGGPSGGAGLIGGDWEVQNAIAQQASGMARRRGDFQASLRQAIIDLGIGDMSKLGNLSKYIDADTLKAAVANKYSRNAQTGQAAQKATDVNRASLAARGILSSGATTKAETDVASQAESQRYADLREVLAGGAQGLSGLADAESEYANAIAMARGNAAGRAAETYPDAFAGEETFGQSPAAAAAAQQQRRLLTRAQFAKRPILARARNRTAAQRYANYARAFKRQSR